MHLMLNTRKCAHTNQKNKQDILLEICALIKLFNHNLLLLNDKHTFPIYLVLKDFCKMYEQTAVLIFEIQIYFIFFFIEKKLLLQSLQL